MDGYSYVCLNGLLERILLSSSRSNLVNLMSRLRKYSARASSSVLKEHVTGKSGFIFMTRNELPRFSYPLAIRFMLLICRVTHLRLSRELFLGFLSMWSTISSGNGLGPLKVCINNTCIRLRHCLSLMRMDTILYG